MNKNYLQMEVGGELRGLKFSNRTLNLIEELSGNDPLLFSAGEGGWQSLLNYSSVILCAALICNQVAKKEEVSIKLEQVKEWMIDLTPGDIAKIAQAYQNFLNPNLAVSREADGNTQGTALMAAS